MIHPIQYLNKEARKIASDNGCSIAEARASMEENDFLPGWLEESLRWMRTGPMKPAWWNAVINNPTAHALVANWLKYHPGEAAIHKHDMDYALSIVRRDARNALNMAQNT